MGAPLRLEGKVFGELTVVRRLGASDAGGRNIKWLCRCSCGRTLEVYAKHLVPENRGRRHCGCKPRKPRVKTGGHRAANRRLYSIWANMRTRCSNPNTDLYHRYGGRGITVCYQWDNYVTFRDWAISSGYSDELQIDRIDNDDGYRPENCRWVTCKENTRNTSRNRLLTHMGETLPLSAWAERFGVSDKLLHSRIKRGWCVERSLTTPARGLKNQNEKNRTKITHKGVCRSVSEWAQIAGISPTLLWERIFHRKWDVARALSEPVHENMRTRVKADPGVGCTTSFCTQNGREVLLTHNGRTQRMCCWEAELGINHATLRGRLRGGWSVYRAFTEPVHPRRENLDA